MSKVSRKIAWSSLSIVLTVGFATSAAAQVPDPQPEPAAPVAEPQAPVVVELSAVGGAEGSGEASLEAGMSGETEATLQVEGLAPGTQWSGFLVGGTCEQPGDVIAPLGTVEVADQGSGRGEASVTTALADLTATAATVQVHPQGETPTQAVLCGALPAAAGPSIPAF